MGWLGTGIGAGIGFMFGGPIGAAIGAGVGSVATASSDIDVTCPHCKKDVKIKSEGEWICPHCDKSFTYELNAEENNIIFTTTFVSMLAKMAKADGIVTKEESQVIKDVLDSLELDTQDRKIAISIFNDAKDNDTSIYEYAKQYATIADEDMRVMIYEILWSIARADGKIHKQEDNILRSLPQYLNIDKNYYDQNSSNSNNSDELSLQECYTILKCDENSDLKEIKANYRKQIREYHPDTIQSKGLPEVFLEFANQETQKINQAYKILKKYKGQID